MKMMTDVIMALVEEGLKQHELTDQCKGDLCIDHYGPEGSPGRCRWCYDAQQGEGCDDARRYAAIRDALNSLPSDCDTSDPLDENDHRDRIDTKGQRWTHRGDGAYPWCLESCYCSGVLDLYGIHKGYGSLRFADGGLK